MRSYNDYSESLMSKTLNNILKGIFIVFLLLFPSFFTTFFVGNFELSKIILLILASGLAVFLLGVELAVNGKVNLKISSFDLPLLILVLSFVVSAVINTPNKMEAFLLPGSVTVMVTAFLLYFFSKKAFGNEKGQLVNYLFFSGLIVSFFSLFSFLGVFDKIPQLPAFMKEVTFSPVGGKLPEVIFLLTLIPMGISLVLAEKEGSKKILFGISTLIILMAGILGTTLIIPGKPTSPILAGAQTSWSIAADALKTNPVFGFGPGNYLTAFSRFLPITHNATEIWSVRFSSARNFLFTLITEVGLAGLLSFLFVVIVLVKSSLSKMKEQKNLKNHLEMGLVVSILLLVLSLLLFPANMVLITLFFLLLSLNANEKELTIKIPSLLSSILFLLVGVLFYFSGRAVVAERQYKLAINSIIKNDGKSAYDGLRLAINTNPYVDRYHSTYSQVNIALARGLAQKTTLTDAEKETVAQLIQQAIREAKAVVSLNPQRAGSWEILARTYQTIIPFAQGADEYTIQTFNQAVSLDPVNPNLRIGLGGVYYALGKYPDAIKAFELAVAAKPDLANAHFNLSAAYRENKETDKAISEMKIVLSLVAKDSSDYTAAMTELTSLEKNKLTAGSQGTNNLVPPQKSEDTVITPQIELPSDTTPPVNN